MTEIGKCFECGSWLTMIKGEFKCPKCSKPSNVVKKALEEIRLYNVDPDHLGSISTIGVVEEILKEAID